MAIFDQFDIGTHIEYSRSYSDNIIRIFSGSGLLNKKFIGSKTGPINSTAFEEFEIKYSDFTGFAFGKYKGRNNNFITINDSEETFYDSQMVSPLDYHEANGKELVMCSVAFFNAPGLNMNGIPVSTSLTLIQTDIRSDTVLPGEDREFLVSYPFEKKYNSLTRLKKTSKILSKNYNCTWALDNFRYVQLPQTASLNVFSGKILFNHFPRGHGRYEYHETNFDITNTTARALNSISGTNKISDLLTTYNEVNNIQQIDCNIVDSYKMYFGFARKNHYRGYLNYTMNSNDSIRSEDQNFTQRRVFRLKTNLSPAGWKYGIYNALPTNPNIIFRRNRFGQFRDMLEQRPYSKFNLNKKNTISKGPVLITFVSGTTSYVTSTNDFNLNVRDSGIYRKEYTSGKPFADDI